MVQDLDRAERFEHNALTITVLSKDVDKVTALDTLGNIGKALYLYAQQ